MIGQRRAPTTADGAAEATMARITMECVVKSFGRTEVIKGVDLAIEDKSTLLRLVAGIGMMFARKPESL